jgi:DDE superfamily endonuclease
VTIEKSTTELEQFRHSLYQNFNNRADTLMELVDALCSSPAAQSAAELTLAASFRRSYSALYKAVDEFEWGPEGSPTQLAGLLAPYLPRPHGRPFWLLGVDVTPQRRPFAPTLSDRGMVYQPNLVKGNKPVTIGHQYASVALLPEVETGVVSHWLLSLMLQRVATTDDKERVGATQIDALLSDGDLPFARSLCVEVGDTSYSKPEYLQANRHHHNLVTIARARSNRTFYRQVVAHPVAGTRGAQSEQRRGHPTWYGDAFCLKNPATWHPPDETVTMTQVSRGGKCYQVGIQAWHNLLMPGKQKPSPLPMHRHPFTLVRLVRYDEQGVQVGQHPLWLIVIGEQRHALSLLDIYHAYPRRYDLEHFFRFGKQKLLLVDFQTPETEREEAWWQLVQIAYAQLWMARHVAHLLPRPWQRNLPVMRSQRISPTLVQRDFGRIIRQLGTPAQPPKRRGNSAGRPMGMKLAPRPRHKVVVKRLNKAASP